MICGAGGGSAMAGVGLVAAGVALASGGGRSLIDTVCSAARKGSFALAGVVSGGSSSAATNQKNGASSGSKNKVKSATVSTPASPPDPNGNGGKHSYNEIRKNSRANKIAQEFGYENAETFKDSVVGRRNGGRFNMAIDTVSKEVVLIKIQGGIVVPTGYFLEILIY